VSAPASNSPIVATDVIPIGSAEPVAATLPAAIARLVKEVRPQQVVLFGSYAYGAPTPHSDVDLLVVLESSLPFIKRQVHVSKTLLPRLFPIDLIVVTPAELAERLANGNQFFTEIVQRGRVIYERPA
jgi:predicted nucleotidyltransferase